MADTIQIKRSAATPAYPALAPGELAYSGALPGQLAVGKVGGGNDVIGTMVHNPDFSYVEGVSRVIGANGLVYVANTTAKWRERRGVASGSPDLSDPPALGTEREAWVEANAANGLFYFNTMQAYLTGTTVGEKVESACNLIWASGGGRLGFSDDIVLSGSDDIFFTGTRGKVHLFALRKGVEIRATGTSKAQLIRMNTAAVDVTIEGFTLRGDGLVTSNLIGVAGTGHRIINNTITDRDPEAVFDANGACDLCIGVNVTDSCDDIEIKGNKIYQIAMGVRTVEKDVGKNFRIIENYIGEYNMRGIYAQPASGVDNEIRIERNQFGPPSNLPNYDGDNINTVKQPIGFQQATDPTAKWGVVRCLDNWGTFSGDPYIQDNPIDSPGEGSQNKSVAPADVFSFHRVKYLYFRFPSIEGGGEVGGVTVSHGVDLAVFEGGAVRWGDVCAVNAGAANQDPLYRVGKVVIKDVTAIESSRDMNTDHTYIAPFMGNDVDEIVITGCSTINRSIPAIWDAATTYNTGDQIVYKPAAEGDPLGGAVFVSLVDGNTGNTPTEDGPNWQLAGVPEIARYNVRLMDVGKFSESGNVWGETLYRSLYMSGTCGVQQTEMLTECLDADWPAFLPGTTNNNFPIYVSDLGVYQVPDGAGGRRTIQSAARHIEDFMPSGVEDYGAAVNAAIAAGHYHLVSHAEGYKDFLTAIDTSPVPTTDRLVIDAPAMRAYYKSTEGMFVGTNYRDARIRFREVLGSSLSTHCFNHVGSLIRAKIEIDRVNVNFTGGSFIYGRDEDVPTSKPQFVMYGCHLDVDHVVAENAGCSFIDIVESTAQVRENRIDIEFGYGSSSDPLIKIENTHTGGNVRNKGNQIAVNTAEVCNGGIVHLAGDHGSDIRVESYDIGTFTDDAVKLYSSGGGPSCLQTTVRYSRNSGAVGTFHDVNVVDAEDCDLWIKGHNVGAGQQVVDAGGNPVYMRNPQSRYVIVSNDSKTRFTAGGEVYDLTGASLDNSNTALTVYSKTMQAAELRRHKARIDGYLLNDAGANGNIEVEVLVGGVVLYSDLSGIVASADPAVFRIDIDFHETQDAQLGFMLVHINGNNFAADTGSGHIASSTVDSDNQVFFTGTQDTGVPRDLQVTLRWTVAASGRTINVLRTVEN